MECLLSYAEPGQDGDAQEDGRDADELHPGQALLEQHVRGNGRHRSELRSEHRAHRDPVSSADRE